MFSANRNTDLVQPITAQETTTDTDVTGHAPGQGRRGHRGQLIADVGLGRVTDIAPGKGNKPIII